MISLMNSHSDYVCRKPQT